jgi:hypothetical protein
MVLDSFSKLAIVAEGLRVAAHPRVSQQREAA